MAMASGKSKNNEETDIYRDCDTLFFEILRITPNFPREYKYTVGAELHRLCMCGVGDIVEEMASKDICDKRRSLVSFKRNMGTVAFLVRKAAEMKWINIKKYSMLLEIIGKISDKVGVLESKIQKRYDN